jgi:maltoporin
MQTKEWDTRDDLAVAFMQALITGRMAAGHAEPSNEAKIWAGKAYALADGFLEARAGALEEKQ